MIRIFHLLDALSDEDIASSQPASANTQISDVIHPKSRPASKFGESRVQFPVHAAKSTISDGEDTGSNRAPMANAVKLQDRHFVPPSQRVRNRIANKDRRYPPLFDYFRALNSNRLIRYATIVAVVIDCVCLGINTVVHGSIRRSSKSDEEKASLFAANRFLNVINTTCLLWFTTYIAIRVALAGKNFYRDGWLIFDIIVTLISIFAEMVAYLMIAMSESNQAMYVFSKIYGFNAIGTFRILLSLKILTQIDSTRAILRAVGRSLAQLVFVVILFLTIGYIFAMLAIIYIDESKIPDSYYFKGSFSSVSTAYITLFQLSTNDHWTSIVNEYKETLGGPMPALAIIYSWLLISAGILRQLFISILVGAYQSIRKEDEEEIKEEERREQVKQQILSDRTDNSQSFDTIRSVDTGSDTYLSPNPLSLSPTPGSIEEKRSGHNITSEFYGGYDANQDPANRQRLQYADETEIIKKNLERQLVYLASQSVEAAWPRDTLLRYFMIMEALLENLRERMRIQKLMRVAILSMNET